MSPHEDPHLAGDVRGFYTALGVDLPRGARTEASVRCFTNPDAHRRGDRRPSCSVNLASGAFNCHGCQASGGAYDAAIGLGHNPRSAIELMIRYGLTERRHNAPGGAPKSRRRSQPKSAVARQSSRRPRITEMTVQRCHQRLLDRPDLLKQLAASRGWRLPAIRSLKLGLDDDQITIPVRDQHQQLISLLRYRPDPAPGQHKIRATYGSQRALFPHPATEAARHLLLVEGEPDAIAARSCGLPAIAIPGVHGWQHRWAPLFTDRQVTIIFDADREGRTCAARVFAEIGTYASHIKIVDLAPERTDGYDLTDCLNEHASRDHTLLDQLNDPRQPHLT